MAQQQTQRDPLGPCKPVFRQRPGPQLAIDVLVQLKHSLLDKSQRNDCRNRFADRCGLKESVGCDRIFRTGFAHTVTASQCEGCYASPANLPRSLPMWQQVAGPCDRFPVFATYSTASVVKT